MPIAYDEKRYGCCYTGRLDRFAVAAKTEAEMFALLMTGKAIARYHEKPFQKPLRMALKKLTEQLDGQERESLETLGLTPE